MSVLEKKAITKKREVYTSNSMENVVAEFTAEFPRSEDG